MQQRFAEFQHLPLTGTLKAIGRSVPSAVEALITSNNLRLKSNNYGLSVFTSCVLVMLFLMNCPNNKVIELIRNWRKEESNIKSIGREKKELLTSSVSPLSFSQVASQSHPFLSAVSSCLCEEL